MRVLRNSGVMESRYNKPSSKRMTGGRSDVTLVERTSYARGHILRSLVAGPMTSREVEQLMPVESSCDLYFHLTRMSDEGLIAFVWDTRNGHRVRVYSLPPTSKDVVRIG